jgi:hypothetical protein
MRASCSAQAAEGIEAEKMTVGQNSPIALVSAEILRQDSQG